jgi:hypothetical protein
VAVVGGTLSFQVRRPLVAGTATVTAQEVTGKGRSTGTATYTLGEVRRFDFNGPSNDTATGFAGVRGTTTYGASWGYGWSVAAPEFERTGPTALRRDGHYGSGAGGNTFTIQVDAGVSYGVRVYVGDAQYPRDQIEVAVEGASAYTIGSLTAGSYDTRTVAGSSSDSQLTITIRDVGGDPYWVVNGIEVWTPVTSDPGVQALRASLSVVSRPLSVVGQALPDTGVGQALPDEIGVRRSLTYGELAPIVEQAIGLWSATGLTREQVALLRSTPVLVGNLDAQGYLGLTTPERIVIDDDGVGRGWYVGAELGQGNEGQGNGGKEIGQRYDLLTTVLHELGHVLGQDHDSAADDLMADILQPGVQHLPAVDAVLAGW